MTPREQRGGGPVAAPGVATGFRPELQGLRALAVVLVVVAFVDIADAVCDAERCPPVIGNVLVYLDDNHLTATYSTSMADLLAGQIQEGLGW